jgi:hypothetical protein
MLRHGQAKRNAGLGLCELVVAPFPRKKRRQKGVVCLAHDEKNLASPAFSFDQYHAAALDRSLPALR